MKKKIYTVLVLFAIVIFAITLFAQEYTLENGVLVKTESTIIVERYDYQDIVNNIRSAEDQIDYWKAEKLKWTKLKTEYLRLSGRKK